MQKRLVSSLLAAALLLPATASAAGPREKAPCPTSFAVMPSALYADVADRDEDGFVCMKAHRSDLLKVNTLDNR